MSEEKKEKKSKLPIIIIAVLVIVLLGGAGFGYYYVQNIKKAAKPAVVLTEYSLGEFLANLADEGGKKYLKVNIVLTYDGTNKKLAEELAKKQNDLKDATLSVLRSKKSSDLTVKGSEDLKVELINRYGTILQDGKVIKIVFTNFLMQ